MMRKAWLYTGYALAFLAALVLGLLLGIPDERIRAYAEHQINSHSPSVHVALEDLSVSGFGGIAVGGLSLSHTVKKSSLVLPEVELDVHPFRWLTSGRVAVDLDARFPAGELRGGSYREDADKWSLAVANLAEVGVGPLLGFFRAADDKELPLEKRFPVGLRGALSGELALEGDKQLRTLQDLLAAQGTVKLALTGAVLDRLILSMNDQWGTAQSFELRNVRLGTVTLEVVADNAGAFADLKRLPKTQPVIVFKKLEIDGPDLEVITDGTPYLKVRKGKFELSDLNASLLIKIKPSLYTRPGKGADGKKETPNSWLKTVLEMDKRAKNALSQGYYGLRLTGLVSKPTPTPYRPLIRGELKDALDKKEGAAKDARAKPADAARKAAEAKKGAAAARPGKPVTGADDGGGAPAASGSMVGEPVRPAARPTVEPRPSEALEHKINFKGAAALPAKPEPSFNPTIVPPNDDEPAAEEPAAEDEAPAKKKAKAAKKKAADEGEEGGDEGEEGGDEGGEGGDEGDEGDEGGDEGDEGADEDQE